MNRSLRVFLLVASAYIAAQMLADIASLRIITVAGFAVDAGTLVYPFVSELPADLATGPQTAFGEVLAPVWRIVVASILAEVLSELVDTEVYQRWVERFRGRYQWGRVLASNSVAVPLDSALFVSIAFVGVLPSAVVLEVFWVNVVIKGLVTLISIPWIYLVRPAPLDVAT